MELNRVYTITEIKNKISPLAKDYGVERVYLFGSYAKGEATEDSDVDLRIDSGEILSLFVLGGLYADISEILGKSVDIVTTDSISAEFRKCIEEEEIMIYEQ